MSNLDKTVAKLRSVIEKENAQLRKGIYNKVSDLLPAKQGLLAELDLMTASADRLRDKARLANQLKELASLLNENDRLMQTAINSVKVAHRQINIIRNTEKKVGAYNRYGNSLYIEDMPGLKTKLV